ncbi:hypothetical protein ILYODFUR_039115 [Ilyodon furcidens]|uniref:Uncharacterized protein n=1 Tax=Ilyodon furcidens TaxID=33524 RepID=A0ABV0VM96_9TELE
MLLPSSCLHFGLPANHIMTEGTSQQDQADKAQELKKWVQQQEAELRKMHGEEVEILPSPLLLQEMEEVGISLPTPESPVLIPGRMRSSPPSTFSATPTSTTSSPRALLVSHSHFSRVTYVCSRF